MTDPTERWRRRLLFAALALLPVAAIVLVGLWRWSGPAADPDRGMAESDPPLAAALDRALRRMSGQMAPGVAVRPLDVPGDTAAAGVMAEAVCESLSGGLSRLRSLRVASCGSTRMAIAAQLDDAQLGRLLHVNYVLAGRLEPAGDERWRVQLELRDLPSGRARWRIDEALATGALQALPSRVAAAAAQAIGEPAPTDAEPPLDAALYPLMLRARQLARRPAVEERREALALVEQVLAGAPDHTPALYMRLGLRSQLSGLPGGPLSTGSAEQIRAAQAAARREVGELGQRLVAADPRDWRGNLLLINDALMHRRWPDALDRAELVTRHAGNHPGLLRTAARVLLHMGYVGSTQALALEAARIDALDAEAFGVLVFTHGMLGELAAMRELLTVAEQLGHRQLELPQALEALERGDRTAFERAASAWIRAGRADAPLPDWAAPWLAAVADPSRRDEARAAFDAASESVRLLRAEFLMEYALAGDQERARAALLKLAQRPIGPWAQHLWWPQLSALRQDPAFVEAMQALGLVALWEARGAPDLCRRGADGAWSCR